MTNIITKITLDGDDYKVGEGYTAGTGIIIDSDNEISVDTTVIPVQTDLNTKTFNLSSTSDLTTAQAAYDWYLAGKNPIVVYDNTAYILYAKSSTLFRLRCIKMSYIDGVSYSYSTVGLLSFTISSDTVTAISSSNESMGTGNFLRIGNDYGTPYTPQYDGSPATKKYVDDLIVYATQAEYNALLPGALTDGKHYVIYTADSPTPPTPPFVPGANTLLYYPLNGDANDYSGNNRNLTTSNLTYTTLGDKDVAVLGDNVQAYYQVGSGFINGTKNFTFLTYIKYTSLPTYSYLFGFAAAAISAGSFDKIFMLKPNGSIEFQIYDGSSRIVASSSNFISTNVWYHLCGTYDGTTMKFYVNGDSLGSVGASESYDCTYFTLNTNRSGTENKWIQGNISEVIVEDRVWTATEVSDYFNQTKGQYGIS